MPRWFPLVLWTFLGLIPLGVAGFLVQRQRAFEARAIATRGTVTSVVDERNPSSGELRYRATISWTDRDKHEHTYDAFGESSVSYQKGQSIALRYDPNDSNDVRSSGGSDLPAMILAFIGAGFLSISIRELVKKKPAKTASQTSSPRGGGPP